MIVDIRVGNAIHRILEEYIDEVRAVTDAFVRLEMVRVAPDRVRIWLIRTPPDLRRRGLASNKLANVCDRADQRRCTLILTPEPLDDSISTTDLVEWYERFGFVWLDESTMVRHPR